LNRRPTVYETVALPLSYIGFHNPINRRSQFSDFGIRIRFTHDDNFFCRKINPDSAPAISL
jgi:hypothetical protein